ncbi:hypothetical protein HK098_001574 [Nowakowskiella sp. JEL0407]|nr:hypothetical protein HK098_001574 [Nowakowskiella sp. JEL0407]
MKTFTSLRLQKEMRTIEALGKSYFGGLEEENVKNNFTLIYELLDEVCDFGLPQNTESETLKLYITTEGVKSERALSEIGSKIAIQTTGAVAWRRPDIKYRKNEAFVDVIESVNLIMSQKGTILRADVSGSVMMRAYLSGMPECKFGLNDHLMLEKESKSGPNRREFESETQMPPRNTVELDDCQFHQCVRLTNFESSRTISFIPPDGEFELMKYRTTENINLPFRIYAVANEVGKTRLEYKVSVKSHFSAKIFAQNVVLKVPTPPNTCNTLIKESTGKAKYVGSENCVVWKIQRFQGQQELFLSIEAELTVTTSKKAWSRPPISMDFQVLMFTASGFMVRFLKIFEKSNYQSVKWVRYMTKAGSYQVKVRLLSLYYVTIRITYPCSFRDNNFLPEESSHTIAIPNNLDIVSLIFNPSSNFPYYKRKRTSGYFMDYSTKTKVSFKKLKQDSLSLAAGLIHIKKLSKWDVVAICAPNHIHFPLAVFGTLIAGGTVSPINPTYTLDELIYQLLDCKAKYIFVYEDLLENVLKAADNVGIPHANIFTLPNLGKPSKNASEVQTLSSLLIPTKNFIKPTFTFAEIRNNPAYLCYSSGTTGKPKGVITTHFNMVSNVLQFCFMEKESLALDSEMWVAILPFFHIYGLTILMHASILSEIPVILHQKFDLVDFLESIQRFKITRIRLAPPVVLALANHPIVDKYDLSSVKVVSSGAAPLTAELSEKLRKRMNVIVKQGYGMTEMSPISHMEIDSDVVPGSVGVLMPNCEALIVDPVTQKRLGVRKEGELWVRGPMVMKGYLNNEEATRSTLDEDGWLHTGDIAYADEGRHFFIVDRLKELIKYKGYQVAPSELEGVLSTHPAVADAAVVGIPVEGVGEYPRAYVVLRPDFHGKEEQVVNDIIRFMETKTAPHKWLRGGVEVVDTIPKSASGKILRRMLKEEVSLKAKL